MRGPHRLALSIGTLLVVAAPSHGQITIDGTLPGTSFEILEGPDFEIPASKGHQVGSNLFHSFEDFSIGAGGSATFTPEGSTGAIDNVLSRVTGTDPSLIEGRLASTIAGADVYLMNPNGVTFGSGARLDVRGSLYVSTADDLRFDDGTRFPAHSNSISVLTVAHPHSFGFLENNDADLVVADGSRLETFGVTDLALVSNGLTNLEGLISTQSTVDGREAIVRLGGKRVRVGPSAVAAADGFLGGSVKIEIEGQEVEVLGEVRTRSFGPPDLSGSLGDISITADSLAIEGKVSATGFSGGGGTIHALANDNLDMTGASLEMRGNGPGAIALEADHIRIHGSTIVSENVGDRDAGSITISGADVRLSDSAVSVPAGTIQLRAVGTEAGDLGAGQADAPSAANLPRGSILLEESTVSTSAQGTSTGGITVAASGSIEASLTTLSSDVTIPACGALGCDPEGVAVEAFAGPIRIHGSEVSIVSSELNSESLSDFGGPAFVRNGGDIWVRGEAKVRLSDAVLNSATRHQSEAPPTEGSGGSISIEGADIALTRTLLNTSTNSQRGQGGTVTIGSAATEVVSLDEPAIFTRSTNSFAGLGAPPGTLLGSGPITIRGRTIDVNDGIISAESSTATGSGAVAFEAQTLSLAGVVISSRVQELNSTGGGGRAGSITLNAENIEIRDEVVVDASSFHSLAPGGSIRIGSANGVVHISGRSRIVADSAGRAGASVANAGTIRIEGHKIKIADGATVSTEAFAQGPGGDIEIVAIGGEVQVSGSSIAAESSGASIPVFGSAGKAGRILIEADRIELSEGARIETSAAQADAGNITINARDELRLTDSGIATDAFNRNGGNVTISARSIVHLRNSAITANVAGGSGGNVTIDPTLVLFEDSEILAQARVSGGSGGRISIRADLLLALRDGELVDPLSVLDASAPSGPQFNGTVEVNAPDTDIAGTLTALPAAFTDPASRLTPSCAGRGDATGRFTQSYAGLPSSPSGFLVAYSTMVATP